MSDHGEEAPTSTAEERAAAASAQADHLVVLVHGLWGNPSHLQRVREALEARPDAEKLHVLVAKRNSDNYTYDGIEVGGERVAQEIEDELAALAARRGGTAITKLSVVGYSLGGLIARYCIGLLFSRGWFDKLQPVNFTAFASPFLGVRTPNRGYHSQMYNAVAAQMLSASGRQLFLIDDYRHSGRPLLEVLADPQSIFLLGLKRFRRRTLYANIINDRSAPWFTTGIARSDPFIDLDSVTLNYMKGYDAVLLDPDHPVQRKAPQDLTLYARMVHGGSTFLNNLPTYALFTVLMPIGLTAFTINSGIQSVRSAQRVQQHNAGQAGSFDSYRIPYLVDSALETINAEQSAEFLSESETSSIDPKERGAEHPPQLGSLGAPPGHALRRRRSRGEFPLLALDEKQFRMIDELNEVGFHKYPVHISKVRHSHAAIIVRRDPKTMAEGFVVLQHWMDHEFDA